MVSATGIEIKIAAFAIDIFGYSGFRSLKTGLHLEQ
jgi:hypothetical protein